jgi:hypothetical protein
MAFTPGEVGAGSVPRHPLARKWDGRAKAKVTQNLSGHRDKLRVGQAHGDEFISPIGGFLFLWCGWSRGIEEVRIRKQKARPR